MTNPYQLFGAMLCLFCLAFCQKTPPCRELAGAWSNQAGQIFSFRPNGEALWLIQFGSQTDSFPIRYQYDCGKKPARLDLSGFHTGPLKGKTLFGILEWKNDTAFRFDCEPGMSEGARPAAFNLEQTETYFRVKGE